MKRDVRLERVYPHPIDRVWRAITDPRAIASWLMENDFRAEVGHRFNFHTKPRPGFDGTVYCEVTDVEAPRRLVYTWRGGPGPGQPLTLDTVVAFTLEEVREGTRLVLEHRGFEGTRAVLVSFIMGAGWAKMMRTRLAVAIEKVAQAA